MGALQTEIESQTIGLAAEAFKTFCEDISGMFGVDMACEPKEVRTETVEGLKKRFKKLAAVNVVQSEGSLSGTFQLIFDQEGLFTLGGVIVMLPEETILANREDASPQLAVSMVDAVAEAGNFLVGSWDRVFREGLKGHGHFLQRLPAFVGRPWDKPEETIGLAGDEGLLYVAYEMTIGSYPAFNCGVIFPKTIFGRGPDAAEDDEAEEEIQETQADDTPADKAELEQADTAQRNDGGTSKSQGREAAKTAPKETTVKATAGEISTEEMTEAKAVEAQTLPPSATESEKTENPATGEISETIRRMAECPAILPGESGQPALRAAAPPAMPESTALRASDGLWSMGAKDVMKSPVIWASPEETVQQAVAKMQQHDTGYLMIGRDGILEGLLSRSDIAGALSPYLRSIFAKWRRPLDDATLKIKIKWIMSRPVRTVRPQTPLATLMENVCRFGGRAVPVVDDQGKVQGLVTVFDVFQTLLKTGADISTVGNAPQTPPLV